MAPASCDRSRYAEIPREQFPRCILATSRPTRPPRHARDILARMLLLGCRACRATSPFSSPRSYAIGRPAVCCDAVLRPFVRVSCRSPASTSPTRTTCCGPPRENSRSILVRHVGHARFPRDMLATSSRGFYEDAIRGNCSHGISAVQRVS